MRLFALDEKIEQGSRTGLTKKAPEFPGLEEYSPDSAVQDITRSRSQSTCSASLYSGLSTDEHGHSGA